MKPETGNWKPETGKGNAGSGGVSVAAEFLNDGITGRKFTVTSTQLGLEFEFEKIN